MKKKKFFLFLFLILGVYSIYVYLAQNNYFNTPELNRLYYKQALSMKQSGSYRNAYYAFKKVSPRYLAYDGVLFNQAECAAKIEDEKTVVKKLTQLIKLFPNSNLQPLAHYKLAQTYIRLKDDTSAQQIFKQISKKFPKSEYKIAAYYYVGRINKERDPEYAESLFKKYLAMAPCGIFSLECVAELISMKAELSSQDKLNIAVAFYYKGKSKEALKYLNELDFKKSWYFLAKAYSQDGDNRKALKVIKSGLRDYSTSLDDSKLFDIVQLYSLKSKRSKYDTWSILVTLTKATAAEDYTLFNKARVSSRPEALKIYKKIVNDYPNGSFASESMWELIWNEYKAKNYKNALYLLKVHREKFINTNAAGKVLFWTAKILEKQGNSKQALYFYEKLLNEYNNDYYAYRANGRMLGLKYGKDPCWDVDDDLINVSLYAPKLPYTDFKIRTEYGDVFLEFLKVEDLELLSTYEINDRILASWLYNKKGLASKACVRSRDYMNDIFPRPPISDNRWQYVYPLYYSKEINYWAEKNDINAFIVLSLMKEESHFNPKAVSSSNAMGLMQLLPRTARDIANWKNLGKVKKNEDLFKPDVNIKLGSAYIKYTKDTLGKMVFAVAAYNAGPNAVKKWVDKKPGVDVDEFVEDIPYDQTRNYVKKVYRSYWCYSRLYSN